MFFWQALFRLCLLLFGIAQKVSKKGLGKPKRSRVYSLDCNCFLLLMSAPQFAGLRTGEESL